MERGRVGDMNARLQRQQGVPQLEASSIRYHRKAPPLFAAVPSHLSTLPRLPPQPPLRSAAGLGQLEAFEKRGACRTPPPLSRTRRPPQGVARNKPPSQAASLMEGHGRRPTSRPSEEKATKSLLWPLENLAFCF